MSLLIDIGEEMSGGMPICTYRNFPRKPGLTVEQSLAGLRPDCFAGIGIVIPEDLITELPNYRLRSPLLLPLSFGKRPRNHRP